MLVRVLLVCLLIVATADADRRCCLRKDGGLVGGMSTVRFYYDAQSRQCERFTYNGYGGNANNFESLEQCRNTCYVVDCPLCRILINPRVLAKTSCGSGH